jgi:hypothetical protein
MSKHSRAFSHWLRGYQADRFQHKYYSQTAGGAEVNLAFETDWVGDLAYDMRGDRNWPRNGTHLRQHLESNGAIPEARDALREARYRWRQELEGGNPEYVARQKRAEINRAHKEALLDHEVWAFYAGVVAEYGSMGNYREAQAEEQALDRLNDAASRNLYWSVS